MGLLNWFTGTNPAAAVAEGAVTGILGSVDKLIQDFHLPPEQALLWAQKRAELAEASIDSARQMQATTKSRVPAILTVLNTVGFFGTMIYGMVRGFPTSQELMLMVGSLVSGYGMALAYWFGSSSGSQTKDWMLWKSNPSNGDHPK